MSEKRRPYMFFVALLAKGAKLFKLLKFGKVFLTFGSMIVSLLVYSFMLGPWFAVGFVFLLFIHEMGHIIALRIKGYEVPGPVFIPMLGAVIFSPRFHNPQEEAFVGYAGPLIGGIAGLAALGLWSVNKNSQMTLLLGYTSIWLNLFNLIPIRPLDGGRIMQIAGRWSAWIGGGVLFALTILMRAPSLMLVWILVLSDLRINSKIRTLVASIFWAAMVYLMLLGYGDQPRYMNIVDASLSFLFILLYWTDTSGHQYEGETYRAPLAFVVRAKWMTLYAGLAVVLAAAMVWMKPYLPVPHK